MLELKNKIERITNPMVCRQELPWNIYYQTDKLYRRVLVHNPTTRIQNDIFISKSKGR